MMPLREMLDISTWLQEEKETYGVLVQNHLSETLTEQYAVPLLTIGSTSSTELSPQPIMHL